MKFIAHGPDVPNDLVAAQEKGGTIFVCGAGVSRTVGLPLFRGLVEGVYQKLGEDWNLHTAEREGMRNGGALEGQYDRVLRCLERRLIASDARRNRSMRERIRTAVRQVLTSADNVDLANHLALLKLSRDAEGRSRLLTTNFDTLFEQAWFEKHRTVIASHAGVAMPQPKAATCAGVLHLHGRLLDSRPELGLSETDLVLTSAEFGDAYLRSGWASRYVYDLVRAYTVVLVGYQADDPPMRYLLEALEADRERYTDLQTVYAFAPCAPGNEEHERALWRAKAVEPITYTTVSEDHSSLYHCLREWQNYAEDPTAWRRERLRVLLEENPTSLSDTKLRECDGLLGHGDASQLLAELSPRAAWLSVLHQRRVFAREGARPGTWIATRINDPEMIRECAGLPTFDEQTRWHISRAVEGQRQILAADRLKAWQFMLLAKRPPLTADLDESWQIFVPNIKRSGANFSSARRRLVEILRPRFEVKKAVRWKEKVASDAPEALHDLLHLDFQPGERVPLDNILAGWPDDADQEVSLFRSLDRALMEALEEAEDVGFLDHFDRASHDVPSVASHSQNAYRSGFYPITRALADLWHRVADRNRERAHRLVLAWGDSRFLLTKRLWLFAHAHNVFTAQEASRVVLQLDDRDFWISDAQVEIMRILTSRWMEFETADRSAIEARLSRGIPRDLYPGDALGKEQEWNSIRESLIFKRLKRIEAAGAALAPDSGVLLADISARHPKWQLSLGDRDDFHSWHESRWGPDGHPELLDKIPDDGLVKEAMRLQRERHFEEGDIWRVFCSADPDRALRGLRLEADGGQWEVEAWRCLLWAASDHGDMEFQSDLAEMFTRMPEATLQQLLPAATSWLQRRREALSAMDHTDGPLFLQLWDLFAILTYRGQDPEGQVTDNNDLLTQSLNNPGGILASALLDSLRGSNPEFGSGLGLVYKPRFDRAAAGDGRSGLLARVYLCHCLAYLDYVDPNWTEQKLQPRLLWGHLEALELWRSYSLGHMPSARLFNALKSPMLEAFEQDGLSYHAIEGLVDKLLAVGLWHQCGQAPEYALTTQEIRRALTVGSPEVRQNASWQLWRLIGDKGDQPKDGATRWREIVGPFLRQAWPLDAELRSEETAHNFVQMTLECGAAFPEAVDAILDLIVPYQLYQISHSLRLEPRHDNLLLENPIAFVRLTNAIVDPAAYPVPSDLAALLQECHNANPAVADDPAYIRLYGLRRLRGA